MKKETYIEAYINYRDRIETTEWFADPLSYNQIIAPTNVSGECGLYRLMLMAHANQLPDDINDLLRTTVRLSVWSDIIEKYRAEDKLYLLVEFVNPIAFFALNLPYAIQSRFIFSITHLCHQANRFKLPDYKDDLPNDPEIKKKTMENRCSSWQGYSIFKESLNKICDDEYNEKTQEYRHKFHHRLPVEIEVGVTGLMNRRKKGSSVSYGLGGVQPLVIRNIIPLLQNQFLAASCCYSNYRNIINEHFQTIGWNNIA
jgi:hypothetical protein